MLWHPTTIYQELVSKLSNYAKIYKRKTDKNKYNKHEKHKVEEKSGQ